MPVIDNAIDLDLNLRNAAAAAPIEPVGHGPSHVYYRLGDAFLHVVSDHQPFLDAFDALYRDAEVPQPAAGMLVIRCRVTRPPDAALLTVSFGDATVPDLFEITQTFLRLVRPRPSCREVAGPVAGSRQLIDTARGGRPVIISEDGTALVDIDGEGPIFWVQQLVTLMQRAQPELAFFHSASVGVGGVGALLIAPSHGGKTTTALTLAWRGHALLGDDIAAVRLGTRELLPFRQSFGVRDGPLPAELRDRLATCPYTLQDGENGQPQLLLQAGDVFAPPREAIPLRFAFVLEGFGDMAALRPFTPGLAETARLKSITMGGMTAVWGPNPGRQLVRYLAVVHLLSTLTCFAVELGPPAATAALIEEVMLTR